MIPLAEYEQFEHSVGHRVHLDVDDAYCPGGHVVHPLRRPFPFKT